MCQPRDVQRWAVLGRQHFDLRKVSRAWRQEVRPGADRQLLAVVFDVLWPESCGLSAMRLAAR